MFGGHINVGEFRHIDQHQHEHFEFDRDIGDSATGLPLRDRAKLVHLTGYQDRAGAPLRASLPRDVRFDSVRLAGQTTDMATDGATMAAAPPQELPLSRQMIAACSLAILALASAIGLRASRGTQRQD